MDELFNIDEWEVIKVLKTNQNNEPKVYLLYNKNGILINGNKFDKCVLKKVLKNKKTFEIYGKQYTDTSKREGIIFSEVLNDHDKIVQFYGFQHDDQYTYLFLEYIEGQTLKDFIDHNNPLSDESIHKITIEILLVLMYIHSKNIIHLDLSISNILFDSKKKKWRFIDFEHSYNPTIAKSKCESFVDTTPGFYSPESLHGIGTNKLDVWQLGCVLINMHGGELKVVDRNGADNYESKDVTPDIPERVPKLCRNFIKKCLLSDHIVRFNSKYLYSHPYITFLDKSVNSLNVIEADHKLWIEQSQMKRDVKGDIKVYEVKNNIKLTKGLIPDGTVHVKFCADFNQDIDNDTIPKSVIILEFGVNGDSKFNKPLTFKNIPNDIISLTLGNEFTHPIPSFLKLKFLSVGKKRDVIDKIPPNVTTLKYYGTIKTNSRIVIPQRTFNLLMPFCNGKIYPKLIPNHVCFLVWGFLKDEEEIASLHNLPKSVEDHQFSCPHDLYLKLQKKHIPDNISILIIYTPETKNRYLINLSGKSDYLHENVID